MGKHPCEGTPGMFILYSVLAGLVAGVLLGGRIEGLAGLRIRWAAAVLAGMVVQVILFTDVVAVRVGELGPVIYVASTALVVAAVARNLRIAGMPIVLAGALMNLAAILANGGYMPAAASAMGEVGMALPSGYTNSSLVAEPALWFLTDIFALPAWMPFANVFSAGDVVIGAGIVTVIVAAMRRRMPRGGAATAA